MSFKGSSGASGGIAARSNSTRTSKSTTKDENNFKLVMVGDSGVGKSCILEKFLDLSSNNAFISTIGVDVRSHVLKLDGHLIKLQVWDTGGQERYRPVLATCYKNAFGVILVYDVSNKKSFANLQQWLAEVNEFASSDLPKLLIGNKADLLDRREIEESTAAQFAAEKGLAYIETSAIESANIREAFLTLVRPRLRLNRAASTASTWFPTLKKQNINEDDHQFQDINLIVVSIFKFSFKLSLSSLSI